MASKHGRDVATVLSRAQHCLSTWLQHVGWESKDDDDCDAAHVAHADPFPVQAVGEGKGHARHLFIEKNIFEISFNLWSVY